MNWFSSFVKMSLRFLGKWQKLSAKTSKNLDVRTSAILDLVQFPLIVVDQEGSVIRCNHSMTACFGYEAEELIGKPLWVLFSQDQREDFQAWLQLDTSNKKLHLARKKNGDEFCAEFAAQAFSDIHGQGKLLSITDRSEWEHSESERKKYEIILKQKLDESDAMVHQISHDLKSPLRQIAQYTEMLSRELKQRDLKENEKRFLDLLPKLSQKGTELINHILKVYRIDKEDLSIKELNLLEISNNLICRLKEEFPDYTIEYQIDQNLPTAIADEILLHEVLNNLLSNSIKYSIEKKVHLHLGVASSGVPFKDPDIIWSSLAQNDEVIFFLKDQGIGISKENYQEIFQIFRRLHSRDLYEGGHGVGLAIVKKILQMHKGKIWVDSEEGSGATFFFSFGQQASTVTAPSHSSTEKLERVLS